MCFLSYLFLSAFSVWLNEFRLVPHGASFIGRDRHIGSHSALTRPAMSSHLATTDVFFLPRNHAVERESQDLSTWLDRRNANSLVVFVDPARCNFPARSQVVEGQVLAATRRLRVSAASAPLKLALERHGKRVPHSVCINFSYTLWFANGRSHRRGRRS